MIKSEMDYLFEGLKEVKQKLNGISGRESCDLSKCEHCHTENICVIEEIEKIIIDIMKKKLDKSDEEIIVVSFTAYKYILDSMKYGYFLGNRIKDENRIKCKSILNMSSDKIINAIDDKNLREYLWAVDECMKVLVVNKYIKNKNYDLQNDVRVTTFLKDYNIPSSDIAVIGYIDNLLKNFMYKDFTIPYYLKIAYYSYISNIDLGYEEDVMECIDNVNNSRISGLLYELSKSYYLPDLMFDRKWVISTFDRLKKKTVELNRANEKNSSMISRFSHTVTNLLYPDVVRAVVEKLSGDDKYYSEMQKLVTVYRSEKLFYHETKMLELRHNSSSLDIQSNIIESVLKENLEGEEKVGIDYLILYCLQSSIFRIFVNKKSREISIYNNFLKNGISIEELKESYYKNVLFNISEIKKWFNKYLYHFDYNICETWKKVSLVFDSVASALIIELLTEVIFNALTYGSADKNSFINLKLGEEFFEEVSFLTIEVRNSINRNEVMYSSGTKEGLKSIEELLNLIDCIGEDIHLTEKYLIKERSDNEFYVKLLIRSDLIIIE